jgi:ABC-type multidrug transport system ATPase subunit
MIEIKGVCKNFRDQEVLRGIDLFANHETVGLLGTNGAGKTTLLKCILGLLEFDGAITVAGFDVKTQNLEAKKRIGYIPQFFPLWEEMRVRGAMKFFVKLRDADHRRADSLLKEFDLWEHREKRLGALSGGMRQKLSIAIALLPDPEVLLLDEPTASLDAWATREILEILQSLKGRKTILLSSHRLEEVQAVSHRLVQVREGIITSPASKTLKEAILCALPS